MERGVVCVWDPGPVSTVEVEPGQWVEDVLPGYEAYTIALPEFTPAPGEPEDTELVATLVRQTAQRQSPRAVLYLHGWNDYFFQTHLADHLAEHGLDFYALDLRRYGRSLRPGQHRGFITDLADYFVELDAAMDLISAEHEQIVLMGHSTGGLIAALYAAERTERICGLILNSPWLDLQGSAMVRALGGPVIDALGTRAPTQVIKLPDTGFYARMLHSSLEGEWDYDLELKATPSSPIRVGWMRAILQGHQKVAAGLQIEVPILVLASDRTDFSRRWREELRTADVVLDVEQIARRAVRLGRHLTLVRIADGVHDLVLSAPEVRAVVMDQIARWTAVYVTAGSPLARGVRTVS